ncbi:hypothetical protein Tco_1021884, partial [Tanacetum coccineum]
MERAATTASSLEAEQDSEAQVRFEAASKQSNDPPLSRVNTLRSGEDIMKLMELMEHCTKLFELASAKAKIVNEEQQIQALVDKKKVIITETSIRSDLKMDDTEGIDCLPTTSIFAELERMGAMTIAWNEFSSTMASAIICLATNQTFNFSKYIFNNMVKHLEGEVKYLMYLRFMQVFLDKKVEGMTKHKEVYVTPSHTKKVFANMKRPRKGFSGRVTPLFPTMMIQASEDMGEDSTAHSDSHSTPIISQPLSSKPQKKKSRRKQRKDSGPTEPVTDEAHVSTLPMIHLKVTAQAKEITSIKKRVKQLEQRRKSRPSGLRRLRKGRKIEDLNADAEVTLVNETQDMNDDNLMFDTGVLEEQEIKFEKVVEELVVSVATTTKSIPVSVAEVVTTISVSVEIPDELTLAQTLIEIKSAKPKPVTTAAITVTSVRPRAKGIIFHDQEEQVSASTKSFSSSQSLLPQVKDKGKGKMVEPEVPLKKKDQVALDEEIARNLEAQLQAELIEEERLTRQKEEESNIALIESCDNIQAMMEADFELAQRLQAEEHGEITIEERSRLFVELNNRRKKHFKLFDKKMKRVNNFVDMNSEVMKGSETRTKESSKRAGDELASDKLKKQKIDEHVEAEKDDDPKEEEMKKHMEIVQDKEEIAINA